VSKEFTPSSFSILGRWLGSCQQTWAVFSDRGVTDEFPAEKASEPWGARLPLSRSGRAAVRCLMAARRCGGCLGTVRVHGGLLGLVRVRGGCLGMVRVCGGRLGLVRVRGGLGEILTQFDQEQGL